MSPQLPIVLVGPMGAGKTTLSRALSHRLGIAYAPLDWVGFHPMVLDGLDVAAYEAASPWSARAALREPHLIAAVEAVVRDFHSFILDFGAGHAHYDTPDEVSRLQALLAPLPNVFYIAPCADPEEAARLCLERDQARWTAAEHAWDPSREPAHRTFALSACIRSVAKHAIYTHGREVDACVEEMLTKLG